MAFVAPALAAVGGGSAVAGGIALGTAAIGAYSAYEQHQAGKESAASAKAAAIKEADSARQQEIVRRRDLLRALSAQSAGAGASGITTDGSVGAMARRDIRDARNDLLTSSNNSASRINAFKRQAGNAVRQGNIGAASSLLDTASTLYKAGG